MQIKVKLKLSQKLSPQQINESNSIVTQEFEQRLSREIEENPA